MHVGGSGLAIYQFTSGAGDVLVFGGSGGMAITDAGSNDTLVGGSGPSSVTIFGAGTIPGSGTVCFGQAGNASVVASDLQGHVIGT